MQGDLFIAPRPAPWEIRNGIYRYRLSYPTDKSGEKRLCAMLHNPSTASCAVDARGHFDTDPTAAAVIRLARREECAWADIVNPFAACATDKTALDSLADPEGPENAAHVIDAAAAAAIVLVGWGNVSSALRPRMAKWPAILVVFRPVAIGINKDGSPKHPLYMRADAPLIPWPAP